MVRRTIAPVACGLLMAAVCAAAAAPGQRGRGPQAPPDIAGKWSGTWSSFYTSAYATGFFNLTKQK